MVWHELVGGVNQIRGRVVSTEGVLLDSVIPISATPANSIDPDVCWDGERYLVVWSTDSILARFLSSTGQPIGKTFAVAASSFSQLHPSVAFGQKEYLVVWSELRDDYDIYGALIPAGAVMEKQDPAPAQRPPGQTMTSTRSAAIVFDHLGRAVHNSDPAGLPAGVYFVKTRDRGLTKLVRLR